MARQRLDNIDDEEMEDKHDNDYDDEDDDDNDDDEDNFSQPLQKNYRKNPELNQIIKNSSAKGRRLNFKIPSILPANCAKCGHHCTTKITYYHHMRNHHDPHTCLTCGTEFNSKNKWHAHVESVHEQIKRHICPFAGCGKLFYKRFNMTKHANICSKNPVDPKLNPTYIQTKIEEGQCQNKEKPVFKKFVPFKKAKIISATCQQCGKFCATRSIYADHMRNHHDPHICEVFYDSLY